MVQCKTNEIREYTHSECHPSKTDPVPVTRCVVLPDYPQTNYSVLAKISTKLSTRRRPAPLYKRGLPIIMLGETVEVFMYIAPFNWLPHFNSMIGLIKLINSWTLRQSDPCTGLISGKYMPWPLTLWQVKERRWMLGCSVVNHWVRSWNGQSTLGRRRTSLVYIQNPGPNKFQEGMEQGLTNFSP